MPAFSDGIMPQKHLYPQILPTPTHVGRVWPVLTSSGVLCPVTLFLPHDPDALLHSVTVFFSVSSLLSSPSLRPSLSLHHATQFPSHATSSSRSVSTQSEVEPTPTSSLSSASTTAQSHLSSNIQPSNLFQSSKPASPASPHPPDILPGSLSTLQPPASGRVSSTRASGSSHNHSSWLRAPPGLRILHIPFQLLWLFLNVQTFFWSPSHLFIQLLHFLFNSMPSSPAKRISFLDIPRPPTSS